MAMPPPYEIAAAAQRLNLPSLTDDRAKFGALFTVALLKAGRGGCVCESCNMLKRIIDVMEKDLEVRTSANQG
jgi:hypothetical protein